MGLKKKKTARDKFRKNSKQKVSRELLGVTGKLTLHLSHNPHLRGIATQVKIVYIFLWFLKDFSCKFC